MHEHAPALRLSGVGVVLLAFVMWDHPTASVAITLAVLLLVYLVIVEIVSRAGSAGVGGVEVAAPTESLGASHP